MTFGEWLTERMEERGWKAGHVVAALSDRGFTVKSLSTVSRWMDGSTLPDVMRGLAIADAMGASLEGLIAGEPAGRRS